MKKKKKNEKKKNWKIMTQNKMKLSKIRQNNQSSGLYIRCVLLYSRFSYYVLSY